MVAGWCLVGSLLALTRHRPRRSLAHDGRNAGYRCERCPACAPTEAELLGIDEAGYIEHLKL